jgi:hypothetical protein
MRKHPPGPFDQRNQPLRGFFTMAKAKHTQIDSLEATRNALPFFRKGNHTVAASWWTVTPSGDYAEDLKTGKAFAKAFLPMLTYNGGAAALGWIVSDMAIAGRKMVGSAKEYHGIDAVAVGFMLAIGGTLQSAIGGLAIAACAIEKPGSDLGPKFVELVKNGAVLHGLNRNTLLHNPNACIIGGAA